MPPNHTPRRTFKALFCEQFDCSPAAFEGQVFRRILFFHARLLAPGLRLISRNYFADDFRFIAHLGGATDLIDVEAEVGYHRKMFRVERNNFLRKKLKLRVSGGKATRLAQKLFAAAPGPSA